ncbi:MAG: hypothetical protein AVDCRST_MAG18-1836, partial [uncultured Thermomicrobiales bacterium]
WRTIPPPPAPPVSRAAGAPPAAAPSPARRRGLPTPSSIPRPISAMVAAARRTSRSSGSRRRSWKPHSASEP